MHIPAISVATIHSVFSEARYCTQFSKIFLSARNVQREGSYRHAATLSDDKKVIFKMPDTQTNHSLKATLSSNPAHQEDGKTPATVNSIGNLMPVDSNNTPRFFTIADILNPNNLKDKVRDKDYVLLIHRTIPDCLSAIHTEGLRSTADLARDAHAPFYLKSLYNRLSNSTRFTNDPSLIYFKPAMQSHGYPIEANDIVIAVAPEAVFVFDQEHRIRPGATAASHRQSGMPLAEYHRLQTTKPPQTFFSQYKTFVPYEFYENGLDYRPECCLQANRVSPTMFVQAHAAL